MYKNTTQKAYFKHLELSFSDDFEFLEEEVTYHSPSGNDDNQCRHCQGFSMTDTDNYCEICFEHLGEQDINHL